MDGEQNNQKPETSASSGVEAPSQNSMMVIFEYVMKYGKYVQGVPAVFGVMILVALAAIGFLIFSSRSGEPTQGTKSAGGGCYLKDEAFVDKTSVGTADNVIDKLGKDYPKIKENKGALGDIITYAQSRNINPAILIAFWGAEQSFGNPSQAFGCGNKADGSSGATGVAAESKCAVDLIARTISAGIGADSTYAVSGKPATDWATPADANRWIRLLYHYVMGRADQPEGNMLYKQSNNSYVSDENSPRIKFLKILVPDEVSCTNASTNTAGSSSIAEFAQLEAKKDSGDIHFKTGENCVIYNPGKTCAQWCANFVAYVYRNFYKDLPLQSWSTTALRDYFTVSPHTWISKPKVSDIKPGDIFLVQSSGSNSGYHAGIVVQVEPNNINFISIEGNTSGDLVSQKTSRTIQSLQCDKCGVGRW